MRKDSYRNRRSDFNSLIPKMSAFVMLFIVGGLLELSAQKITIASGKFSNPAIWNTPGMPAPGDQVTVSSGHTIEMDTVAGVKYLTIQDGAKLTIENSHKLEIADGITVNGRLDVSEGDITLLNLGGDFKIGQHGYLFWAPLNNTANGTSLFINGVENFNPTSTINIEKWFNYTNTPLGSVVTGNFGNVILNSISNGLIFEWNQQNYFEQHVIMGTLSVNQGWIVLDKSGTIQNTFINAIHLNNINSYLDIHSGDHPGTFTVRTNEIKNTGGTLNGIINGNGNIRMEVNGNFSNLGNICLIHNSGFANTSNGNSYLKITGKYTQTHGDFRGIFNISSTSSGKSEIEIGEAEITGGIFMANYGCHVGGLTSKLKINGNLALDFSTANGKFRGNGLTSLSGIQNNLQLQFTVGGNFTVNGLNGFEFISSGSTGSETVQISGDAMFNSGNIFFNVGGHQTTLLIEKSMFVNGGDTYLSKAGGTLSATVNGAMQINSGTLNIKGSTGNANLMLLGDYSQTGGTVMLHNNNIEPTGNTVYCTVHGNFNNYSGVFIFDNNSTSTVNHGISLNGSSFNLGGNAQFNSASGKFGLIYFDHIGTMMYNAAGTNMLVQNTKQVISSGCTLKINTGNMQSASTGNSINDMIKVSGGGILDLGDQHVYSNQQSLFSGIFIDENGRLRTASKAGLYDGTANASVIASGNMTYYLHINSIVEYYGDELQVVTGTGTGSAQTNDQKYGILEINKTSGKTILKASDVEIRTGLYLNNGEFDLNSYNLTISSGRTFALTRTAGYIRSEPDNPASGGQVKWKNIEAGIHTIPFGISDQKIIPVTFSPLTGFGREFAVSSKRTLQDNRPLPSGINNLKVEGTDGGNDKIIDRWFYIQATGVTADISLSYLPEENTTITGYSTGNFSVMWWSNPQWNLIGGTGKGTITQTGKVTLNNNGKWGYLILASHETPPVADILDFKAKLVVKQVNLEWIAKANILADKYSIERSADEFNYVTIIDQVAMPHSATAQKYSAIDYNPLPGISYYRLKQFSTDGTIKYSQLERISNSGDFDNSIELISIGPNPFSDQFTVTFNTGMEGYANITLSTLNGQKVHFESIQIVQGRNSYTFQSNDRITTGIYLLTISNGKSRITHKLFKK